MGCSYLYLSVLLLSLPPVSGVFLPVPVCPTAVTPTCQWGVPTCTCLSYCCHSHLSVGCSYLYLSVLLLSLPPVSGVFLPVPVCPTAVTPTCQWGVPTCTCLSYCCHSHLSVGCSYLYLSVLLLSLPPVIRLFLPVPVCPTAVTPTCQWGVPTCTCLSYCCHSHLSVGCSYLYLSVLLLSLPPVSGVFLPVPVCPTAVTPTCQWGVPTCTCLSYCCHSHLSVGCSYLCLFVPVLSHSCRLAGLVIRHLPPVGLTLV